MGCSYDMLGADDGASTEEELDPEQILKKRYLVWKLAFGCDFTPNDPLTSTKVTSKLAWNMVTGLWLNNASI